MALHEPDDEASALLEPEVGQPPNRRGRWLLLGTSLVLVIFFRPAVRPYTLDPAETFCLNMLPRNSLGEWSPGSWTYITGDDIPEEWFGKQTGGVLLSSSVGALFYADGTTLKFGKTRKAGPCVARRIN